MKDKDKAQEHFAAQSEKSGQEHKEMRTRTEESGKGYKAIFDSINESTKYAEGIINTIREPLVALDQDFRVISASRSFYDVFEIKPEETIGQLIYDLGKKQWDIPRLRELLENILPQKTTFDNYEVEHDFATIGRRIMLLNARQIHRVLGKERIILLAIEDITEHRRARWALWQSNEFSRNLLENAPNPILATNLDTSIKYVNPALVEITGFTLGELLDSKSPYPWWPKENVRQFADGNLDGRNIELNTLERHYQKKNGERFWVTTVIKPVEEAGEVKYYLSNWFDITERKKVEESLRESEEHFRLLTKLSPTPLVVINEQGEIEYLNDRCIATFGYTLEDTPNMEAWFRMAYPDENYRHEEISAWQKIAADSLNRQKGIELRESRIRCKDGSFRILESYGTRIGNKLLIALNDITDRKLAEARSTEEAIRRRILIDQSRDGIVVIDSNGNVYEANQQFARMLGYSPEEVRQLRVWDWEYQSTPEKVTAMLQSADEKGDHFETRHRRKDGTIFGVEISTNAAMFGGQELIFCVCRDITEHKQEKEATQKSEQYFRTLFEHAGDAIYIIDVEGKHILNCNNQASIELGYSREEILQMSPSDIEDILTSEEIAAIHRRLKLEESPIIHSRHKRKDGTTFPVEIRLGLLNPARPEFVISTVRNVTERKNAEDALRKSEEKLRIMFESTFEGIVVTDLRGIIVEVNNAAIQMHGYANKKELIGLNSFDLLAQKERDRAARKVVLIQKGQDVRPDEYNLLKKDGSEFIAELSGNDLRDVSGQLIGNFVMFRDITERKKAEELIQASLQEKETLLKEVHHRVKNNMQVISSLLRLQSEKVKDKVAISMFKESQNRIQSMALVYNKLYQSQDLASICMADYIQELTVGLIKSYTTSPSRVTARIDPSDVYLGVDTAIPCGLVINELVTNSLKHAFPENRAGQIGISLNEGSNQELELTVSDNGVGIPEGLNLAKAGTLGLKLVTNLVEDQLDGRIEIDRSHGTTFKITFRRGEQGK